MRHALCFVFLLVLVPSLALAQTTPHDCLQAYPDDDAARLRCYDALAKAPRPTTGAASTAPATDEPVRGVLSRDWNLYEGDHAPSLLGVQAYRLNYILAANWTDSPNRAPHSPVPGHTVLTPVDLDATEVKFQFSLKSQIFDGKMPNILGFDQYRVWFAYTQQSMWQAYNGRNSAPFRDSMYEPEFILTLGQHDGGQAFKLLNIGFNHQSNGRSDPYSRSWWRTYVQAGFEVGQFTILGRAWWRIHEARLSDDNPDIDSYMGRGDVDVRWDNGRYAVDLLVRDNLSFTPNRAFGQLDVSVPWLQDYLHLKNIELHFQATTGYGETLLDYNHRQTTLGIGVALGDARGKSR
jgi:phospholipase A1